MKNVSKTPRSPLVPGRECGECTACCVNLRINEPTLRKPANVTCPHLTSARGCGIYRSRPSTCKSFHCGWRMLGGLDEEWRPDRSKVMIRVEEEGVVLEGLGSMKPILAKSVLEFIGVCIEYGITMFISIPGKPGCTAAKLPLNQALALATTRRERGAVMRELIKACEYGMSAPPPVK